VPPARPSPPLQPLQRPTMPVLVVTQLLGALSLAAGGTAGALLAKVLAAARSAGLPLSLLVLLGNITQPP
jgi:hypothetical protein